VRGARSGSPNGTSRRGTERTESRSTHPEPAKTSPSGRGVPTCMRASAIPANTTSLGGDLCSVRVSPNRHRGPDPSASRSASMSRMATQLAMPISRSAITLPKGPALPVVFPASFSATALYVPVAMLLWRYGAWRRGACLASRALSLSQPAASGTALRFSGTGT
jgi:hypothetical protein